MKLADGRELLLQATLDQLEKALRQAQAHDALLRIEQPDGTIIAVRPSAVDTIQEAPEEADALAERLQPA